MSSDSTIPFSSNDQDMEAAIKLARMSLGVFLSAFSRPKKNQKSFLVKVNFKAGEKSEHIWLADLDLSKIPSQGVVANEPASLDFVFMQTVEFDPSQISDWMYMEDGYLVGGFTTEVIRRRMTVEDRANYEANAPYKFRSDEEAMAKLKEAWDALEK